MLSLSLYEVAQGEGVNVHSKADMWPMAQLQEDDTEKQQIVRHQVNVHLYSTITLQNF